MNIRQTLLASHLLVGLAPLFLVFIILSLVFTVQYDMQVSRNLEKQLAGVRNRFETVNDQLISYTYFLKRAPIRYVPSTGDYFFNNFILNVDQYNIPIVEYTYNNKVVRRYLANPAISEYSSSPAFLNHMWEYLQNPQYNIQFRMLFTEVLSNVGMEGILVLRYASLIYDNIRNDKIGLAVISQPMDRNFLERLAGEDSELVVYVDTGSSIVFNREEMNRKEFVSQFRKRQLVRSTQRILDFGGKGKFYTYQEPLFMNKKQTVATIGIMYGFESINHTLLLLQSVGFAVFAISILIAVLIAMILAGNITRPILDLKKYVSEFQSMYRPVPAPAQIRHEIDLLQKSFSDMSGSIVEYKSAVDTYNDQLTLEVEKKTRELMSQIRGLMLVNELSALLNGEEAQDETEFLKQLPAFLKESYRLRYLSVFDVRGPSISMVGSECFEALSPTRQTGKRLQTLEAVLARRIRKRSGRILRQNGGVVVAAFPVVIGDHADYIVFLVANARSLQLLFDTVDTVANMVAMKIDSLRITRLKIESEKLASIGQFASTVVHDIKNPLTVIKSLVEVIHDPDFTEEEKQGYYQTLRTEIELLTYMLNDILDFSRGQLNLNRETVDIDRMLADLVRFYARSAESKKLTIRVEGNCGVSAEIDRNRIWRSIGNLVQNAIDVLPPKGSIWLEAAVDNGVLVLSVRDNGPGIPEEVRENLFQPFFTFGKKDGTGLGLSIVKKIAETHGGALRYDTRIGEGTVFMIRLPLSGF